MFYYHVLTQCFITALLPCSNAMFYHSFGQCVCAYHQSTITNSYSHSGTEKCAFVLLGDDAAPPQQVPLSWTSHNLVPKKRAPTQHIWKGPLKRDPSLCTACPLTTERGPWGHQAPAIAEKKKTPHKPDLHFIWLSFMVDTWRCEPLFGRRLEKLRAWQLQHTLLVVKCRGSPRSASGKRSYYWHSIEG